MNIKPVVLVIGAGAAGSVAIHTLSHVASQFKAIHLASRTLIKCETLKKRVNYPLVIHQIDADDTPLLIELCNTISPTIIINLALPYQDLSIMEACLAVGAHYIDTANYEPKDEAKFCYKWQWDYHEAFKSKGLTAILGCGFDPGVTNAYCAYAAKHYLDSLEEIEIFDCNDGSHGHAFATNFNPEINIREITQEGKYFENGNWQNIPALSISKSIDYPSVGPRKSYLLYHEELESLVRHYPSIKKASFWMTFSEDYLRYLDVLSAVGMTQIEPIQIKGIKISPLEFLKAVLPDPAGLAPNYSGKTCIGVTIKGQRNDTQKAITIYNTTDHASTYSECGAQAVSYTTGVPAVMGALLVKTGVWRLPGVWNVEQLDPDPFMELLEKNGLPWTLTES